MHIDPIAAMLDAEYFARQCASLALTGNRHERRAIAVMERRDDAKRVIEQRTAPIFYGRATTSDIITG